MAPWPLKSTPDHAKHFLIESPAPIGQSVYRCEKATMLDSSLVMNLASPAIFDVSCCQVYGSSATRSRNVFSALVHTPSFSRSRATAKD